MQQSHKGYRRLTNAEREEMSRGLAQGESISAIARRLGRAPSTVSREVGRNSGTSGYRAFSAGRRAQESASSRRNGKSRSAREDHLRASVLQKLKQRWTLRETVKRNQQDYPQ